MRYSAIAGAALAAAQLLGPVAATVTCHTVYATTKTKHVPTSTTTKTVTAQRTKVDHTQTTSSVTLVSSFTVTVGTTTTTVPRGTAFTPIISAKTAGPTASRASQRVRRAAERNGVRARAGAAATTTKYPHSVGCTTTTTRTHTRTTTSTSVSYAYTTRTTTVTTHVPTATVHAACLGSDNIITSFHGHSLSGYEADHALGICFTGSSNGDGATPCMSALACCEAAQTSGYSGWQFVNFTGASNGCSVLAGGEFGEGGFIFYEGSKNGANLGHVWFGNGAYDGGVFGGPEPS